MREVCVLWVVGWWWGPFWGEGKDIFVASHVHWIICFHLSLISTFPSLPINSIHPPPTQMYLSARSPRPPPEPLNLYRSTDARVQLMETELVQVERAHGHNSAVAGAALLALSRAYLHEGTPQAAERAEHYMVKSYETLGRCAGRLSLF